LESHNLNQKNNVEFWNKRNVLVTGCSGYLGRVLTAELLNRGAVVSGIDLKDLGCGTKVSFRSGSLTDIPFVRRMVEEWEVQTCFHLAGIPGVGYSHANPVDAFRANTEATWTFLEACRLYGRLSEIIVTSSNHVYGHQEDVPSIESSPLNGTGTYATSKACADLICRCYGKSYQMPVGIARITNSFGGADPHTEHLITGTIRSVLRGERPVIRSTGLSKKGFLYIEDTIRGLLTFAEGLQKAKLHGEAINFVPDTTHTILEVVQVILAATGALHLCPLVLGETGDAIEQEHLSNTKALQLLGWKPQHTLAEGVARAIHDMTLKGAGVAAV
jgi:CDP-glucose 4,6-dehydratase